MIARFRALLGVLVVLFAAQMALAQATQGASVPAAAGVALDGYQLGTGDRVRIITFGEPSLTGEFQVSGTGTVALPLIGEINAAGATTTALQQRVINALKDGYLNNPSVSVEVLSYRPFYILGEVNKPGEYAFTNGGTVMKAVATAGGFTYRANTHKIFIKHASDPGEKTYPLDAGTPVLPGDTVRVVERHF